MGGRGSAASAFLMEVSMPKYKVAHIREQGQDMLLFPLSHQLGQLTDDEQSDLLEELERRAHAAGLAGGAAVFWQHGGHGHFMGPRPWHPFLRSISMSFVQRNVNREISW
jgi:hypothetical protein